MILACPKSPTICALQQRASDGAWVQYPGGKPDLSATVKAYFALKLMGDSIDAPHMKKARELILSLGGAERCNTYSKFYLAALGQMHYDSIPIIPPELVLLPKWFYFHLDKVSAWSRTMIMPLAVVSSYRPVRQLPAPRSIMELYASHDYVHRPFIEFDKQLLSWKNLFLAIDRGLKLLEKTNLKPLRRSALQKIEEWILKRADGQRSDGLGAIFPPMVYIIIALRCLGYSMDDPRVKEAVHQLDRLMIEEEDSIRLQPCFSPIWDTGIATYALCEAGFNQEHESMRQAVNWLVEKECRDFGDWKANIQQPVEPSGWYFEFNNSYYPDVDDTAMVTMALLRSGCDEGKLAAERGIQWILAMQNEDGGWAAFDRTISRPILEHIPFADHNAIQDPSCPDITGRTLECLGHFGFRPDNPGRPEGRALHRIRTGTRRLLVRPLGRELYLRNLAGRLRAENRRRGHEPALDPKSRRVAAQRSEGRWILRRIRRHLRRSFAQRNGSVHRIADSLGNDGAHGHLRPERSRCCAGNPMAPRYAIGIGNLGRTVVHRHGIPSRVLSSISPLSPVLPDHVSGALVKGKQSVVGKDRRSAV